MDEFYYYRNGRVIYQLKREGCYSLKWQIHSYYNEALGHIVKHHYETFKTAEDAAYPYDLSDCIVLPTRDGMADE